MKSSSVFNQLWMLCLRAQLFSRRSFYTKRAVNHIVRHPSRTAYGLTSLLLLLLLTSACSSSLLRTTTFPPEAMIAYYESYQRDYQKTFQISPRPAATPKEAAEAYLQRYQPGPLPRIFEHTTLYDRTGKKLGEFFEDGRRQWVTIDQISPYLLQAVVATEDASFYDNEGVDLKRLVGAVVQNAESGDIVSGASTITMQLARQLFFAPDDRFGQTLDRKISELFLAQELTELFSKDEILEMYLNLIYFGHLAYGPEAAAQTYFGKSATELSLPEATLLAGIPQKPGEYDLHLNLPAVKERQRTVLDLMVEREYLDRLTADIVYGTPIQLGPDPDNATIQAPHFTFYVLGELSEEWPTLNVRRAGFQVQTTLDLRIQALAQASVTDTVNQLRSRYYLTNGALVAMKPGTAEILAMVGSADYNNLSIGGAVNVTTRPRQPGSTVKPILFAAAFEDNLVSPTSVIWDLPVSYQINEAQTYRPGNYDRKFHGPVTVRQALANSYNIPAVKLLDRLGIDRMREQAAAMGINSYAEDGSYGLGMTLGSNELSLLELTNAYETFADGGQFKAATPFLRITDSSGKRLEPARHNLTTQALSPESAYLITDILSDNVARSPMFGVNNRLVLSRPAAAKTGTSSDWRDNWTMGYTRYLVAGAWAGNNNGSPMRNVSGVTGAGPMWNTFMEAVMADPALLAELDAPDDPIGWEFTTPSDIVRRTADCPTPLRCNEEKGEPYTRDWLRKMGDAHRNDDSFVSAEMATIYVLRSESTWRVGVCAIEGGTQTTAMRLPEAIGQFVDSLLPIPGSDLLQSDNVATTTGSIAGRSGLAADTPKVAVAPGIPPLPGSLRPPSLTDPYTYFGPPSTNFTLGPERLRVEQRAVLEWSFRYGTPLYLGPCNEINETIQSLYGQTIRSVVIQAPSLRQTVAIGPTPTPPPTITPTFTNTPTRTPTPTQTATPTFTFTPTPTNTSTALPTWTATATPVSLPTLTATPVPGISTADGSTAEVPTSGTSVAAEASTTPIPTFTPVPSETPVSTADATATALPTLTATVVVPTATPTARVTIIPASLNEAPPIGPGTYRLLGVAHDNFCPGEYVMGQVLDSRGAPVANARVVIVDEWGNRNETLSKGGVIDYGNYDFPIGSARRDIFVTIVDEGGTPISETAWVRHRKVDETPCHHVVWIANE